MNAFFIGIGGMGMSGLAKILHCEGFKVAGSDRNLDGDYCRRLQELGVRIYPQDGKGPELFMQQCGLQASEFKIVKSTAVETRFLTCRLPKSWVSSRSCALIFWQ